MSASACPSDHAKCGRAEFGKENCYDPLSSLPHLLLSNQEHLVEHLAVLAQALEQQTMYSLHMVPDSTIWCLVSAIRSQITRFPSLFERSGFRLTTTNTASPSACIASS